MEEKKFPKRVFVASPIYNDQCYGSYTSSLLDLQKALLESGISFTYQWTKNLSWIAYARNVLANRFLQDTSATHLLFVDSDIAFDAADVRHMLKYDHDVMIGLYAVKTINWENVASVARKYPDLAADELPLVASSFGTFNLPPGTKRIPLDKPFPVDSGGTGMMLIRREVLEKMASAYPELSIPIQTTEMRYFPGMERMTAFFGETTLADNRIVSEDLSFCNRWRAIGGDIQGCAWFKIRHLGTYEYATDLPNMNRLGLTL